MLSLRRTFAATLTFGSILVAAGPAQALSIQSVSAGSFTTTGTNANTTPISFGGFTAGPASWLSGVKLRIVSGAFSQNVQLVKSSNGARIMTVNAKPTFSFGTTPSSSSTSTPQIIATATNTVNGVGPAAVVTTASGSWTNPFNSLAINTPALRSYFSGSPSITSYSTAYNIETCTTTAFVAASGCSVVVNDDPTDPFMTSTSFAGTLFVDYEYEIPPAATPGPLPIVGAGVAFAASRRLRRRIKLNKPVS
jgi:hypothetical protein